LNKTKSNKLYILLGPLISRVSPFFNS
jgi:hypothetical protein